MNLDLILSDLGYGVVQMGEQLWSSGLCVVLGGAGGPFSYPYTAMILGKSLSA